MIHGSVILGKVSVLTRYDTGAVYVPGASGKIQTRLVVRSSKRKKKKRVRERETSEREAREGGRGALTFLR